MTAKSEPARDVAEWTTLAISVGVITVLAGLILVAFLRQGGDPPELVVRPVPEAIRQTEGGFALPSISATTETRRPRASSCRLV